MYLQNLKNLLSNVLLMRGCTSLLYLVRVQAKESLLVHSFHSCCFYYINEWDWLPPTPRPKNLTGRNRRIKHTYCKQKKRNKTKTKQMLTYCRVESRDLIFPSFPFDHSLILDSDI
jgi:hypothetical protein